MTNETNKIDPAKTDETNMEQLGQGELEGAAGGNIFGDAWDGIKDGAEWVGNEVVEHPIATAATVAGALSGYGAAVKLATVVGSEAAAIMGVGTGTLVAGAAVETAVGTAVGAAAGAVGDMVGQVATANKS